MKTPVEPTPLVSEPLISDEQMKEAASKISAFKDTQATFLQGQRYAARIYESDRAKLIAERDEALEVVGSVVAIWDACGVDENDWTEDANEVANDLHTDGVIAKARTLLSKHK